MELEKVLHMKGGSGEISYAQTSYVARKVLSLTKPTREKAIVELFGSKDECLRKTTLCIADLGCASGPNTFAVVSDLIVATENIRTKFDQPMLEYQVFLNDLAGNDFNTVFKSLPRFHQELKEQVLLGPGQCFVTAVPGSFYGRLFPRQSLHFVHSSYSLYWLSQVPQGLQGNKGNIYMSSTSSSSVVKAYKEQFQKDTLLFLKSRSEELVTGGRMVLTYWGRSNEDPTDTESCLVWDLLANALNELVFEGIIDEEKVDTFNIPVYHPSLAQVIEGVETEGSFFINGTDISQVNVTGQENGDKMTTRESCKESKRSASAPSKLLRSVVESLFTSHFGEAVIDEIFRRFTRIFELTMSKHSHHLLLTNVTISVTKK